MSIGNMTNIGGFSTFDPLKTVCCQSTQIIKVSRLDSIFRYRWAQQAVVPFSLLQETHAVYSVVRLHRLVPHSFLPSSALECMTAWSIDGRCLCLVSMSDGHVHRAWLA